MQVPPDRVLVRCSECRLLFASEARDAAIARAGLSDAERRMEERVAERRTPHFARMLAAVPRPGRLLDVGSGIGELLRIALDGGWTAVGVEVDGAMAAYARARGVDVRVGELVSLGLPESSFDLVTLWNVLDFVPDPLGMLRECRRVLAPGGRIFVRTPNVPLQREGARLTRALGAVLLRGRGQARPSWLGVFNTSNFSAHTLRVVLERAGFRDIELQNSRPIGGDPYLGLGPLGERLFGLGKLVAFGLAQAAALTSGGRWLLSPTIEAWARKPA